MPNTKNSQEFIIIKTNKILIEQSITKTYGKYLAAGLISKVSNLISIDYFYRLHLIPVIEVHIEHCLYNLDKYIQNKHITDTDFGQAMTLFVASITEYKDNQDDDEILQKSQDIVIDNIINSYYPDIDKSLLQEMRFVLSQLITDVGPKHALNFISTNPISFKNKIENKALHTDNLKSLDINTTANSTHLHHHKALDKASQIASAISAGPIMSILGIGALVTTGLVAAPLLASSLAEATEHKMITQTTKQQTVNNQLESNLSSLEKYAEKKSNTINPRSAIMQKRDAQKLLSKKGGNNLGR
jgi:hypothetical protein